MVVLTSSMRDNLFSLLKTQALLDKTQNRLATGKKVNTALDNPDAFFASQSLSQRAGDLGRRLDGIEQNFQTIKAAGHGLEGIERLLEQAEALTHEVLAAGSLAPAQNLTTQILASNPVGYWRLSETGGTSAGNLGSAGGINGQYIGGVTLGDPPIYDYDSEVAASFNGTTSGITIPNSGQINLTTVSQRTVELVFRADSTAARQVLYEEGGTVNALNIYIENGRVYANGTDSGDWGPFDISRPIAAGRTYHVALVLDQPNGEFRAYLDGALMGTGAVTIPLSNHSGGIGIGRMNNDSYFHDGPQSGSTFSFDGQIAEVALYNTVLSQTELQTRSSAVTATLTDAHLIDDFEELKTQIDNIARDSGYRGRNLLRSDTLVTVFDEEAASILNTLGDDFTSVGLGLDLANYSTVQDAQDTLVTIRAALEHVREYGASLATHMNIIQTRENYTDETINILTEGAGKLTLADMQEEGAKLLALQTGQQLGVTSLQLAARARESLLQLFNR